MYGLVYAVVSSGSGFYAYAMQLVSSYGVLAVFILMALEGSSLPIPSEVVLPLAGGLVAANPSAFNFWVVLAAAIMGSTVGLAVDYYIGYFIGKDIVYKHLNLFRVKKSTLDNFDEWFDRNRIAVVFLSRFIPVFRTVMSIPAGFARMDKKAFFAYSIAGTCIWDIALMAIGFYTVNSTTTPSSAIFAMTIAGVMVLAVYLIYKYSKVHSRRNK
jgi:membrane protein DedA with SNARE-associated domain